MKKSRHGPKNKSIKNYRSYLGFNFFGRLGLGLAKPSSTQHILTPTHIQVRPSYVTIFNYVLLMASNIIFFLWLIKILTSLISAIHLI